MKYIGAIILCILLIIMFSGCDDDLPEKIDLSADPFEDTSTVFDKETIDVTEPFLKGEFIGKKASETVLPADNKFYEGNDAVGFSELSVCEAEGSITCHLSNDRITSVSFGTKQFLDMAEFNECLKTVNQKVASLFKTATAEIKYHGMGETDDELKSVMSGGGTFSSEYEIGNTIVSVKGVGTNDTGTVMIEVSNKR